MISDEALADQSPLQIEGHVLKSLPAHDATLPSTDYFVLVERIIKGSVSSSTIIVRVPGGVRADGMEFYVPGAPVFAPGEQVLLFLQPRARGTYGISQLALGAFRQVGFDDEAVVVRHLWEANRLDSGPEDQARNHERFVRWLSDRQRGAARQPDYFSGAAEGLEKAPQGFNLTRSLGRRARWFEFDSGGEVPFSMDSKGFDGSGSGFRSVNNAIDAWSDLSGTSINYVFGSRSKDSAGFVFPSDRNVILFRDPNGEIDGAFSCATGGTLAIGGFWFDPALSGTFDGKTFWRILEADIIFQNGTECEWNTDRLFLEEVLTHELGHTLGISHSCGDDETGLCNTDRKDDATMRAFAHDDGRGASLSDDDLAAADRLYGTGEDPAAPDGLTATVQGGSSVQLSWNDNSDDEMAFKIQQASGSGGFSLVATVDPDVTLFTLAGLSPGSYTFRVRANRPSGRTRFSNEVSVTLGGSQSPAAQTPPPGGFGTAEGDRPDRLHPLPAPGQRSGIGEPSFGDIGAPRYIRMRY